MTAGPPQQTSFIPQETSTYLSKSYWDDRFGSEEGYEWCKSFSDFGHLLQPHFSSFDAVLEIGAGNSGLSASLMREFSNLRMSSLDISQVAAESMQARQASKGDHIEWQVADMLCLPHRSGSQDVVIEKGALDVFLVDRGSPWDPTPQAAARMRTALSQIHRVLCEGGRFISITFDQPHFRRPFLEATGLTWDVQLQTFGEGFHYFVYTMHKGARMATSLSDIAEASQKPILAESANHEHMEQEDYLLHMDL